MPSKFKCRWPLICAALSLACLSLPGRADLEPRDLDGDSSTIEAVYDTDRDITWAADANLFAELGGVTWYKAIEVVAGLNDENYLGFSDWRLPITKVPDNTCSQEEIGLLASGYNCTGSEMGHLFYEEFEAAADTYAISTGIQSEIDKFENIADHPYWSLTEHPDNPDYAYSFTFRYGAQGYGPKDPGFASQEYLIWPVRSGDVLVEICDNGVDDDGDGLVDAEDYLDCFVEGVGLNVQCLHEPLYPEAGDAVTVRARTFDENGAPVDADRIEIYINGQSSPHTATDGSLRIEEATEQANGEQFSYSCRAQRNQEDAFSRVITVDVGNPELDYAAVPVIYRGPPSEKIDLVFFPEINTYPGGASDPQFEEDLRLMLRKGLFEIPWYLTFQDYFNVWIGTDTAEITRKDPDDSTSKCKKDKPDGFKKRYNFANAVGIIHAVGCRDNAGARLFSTELDLRRLQVLAHEIGHSAYSLPDEYCCDGGYFPLLEKPSLFLLEANCRFSATERGFDPDHCRQILTNWPHPKWWLFELRYEHPDHPLPRPHDIMQGTGCISPRQPDSEDPQCDYREATLSGPDQDPNGVVACDYRVDTYRGDPDGIPHNDDDRYWLCIEAGSATNAVWQAWSAWTIENVFGDRVPQPIDATQVGPSENGRMIWKLGRCMDGKC